MNHCGDDFLRVTDGSCADAIRLPYTVYCGLQKPDDVYISTQNKMCLKFVSDDTGSNKGFSIKYTAVNKRKDEEKLIGMSPLILQICSSKYIECSLRKGVYVFRFLRFFIPSHKNPKNEQKFIGYTSQCKILGFKVSLI